MALADPATDAVVAVVARIEALTGTDLSAARDDARLTSDLGWDSLTMCEVVAAAEECGVVLHEDLLAAVRTVGDLRHWIDVLSSPDHRTPGPHPEVELRPLTPADEPWAAQIHFRDDLLRHHRFGAGTPSPMAMGQVLWDAVLVQFVVLTPHGERAGIVTGFDPDFQHRRVHVSALADPSFDGLGYTTTGLARLASHLFAGWDLRKICAECTEADYASFRSGAGRVFELEGVRRDHLYAAGRYQDLYLLAVHRDRWRDQHRRLFRDDPPF